MLWPVLLVCLLWPSIVAADCYLAGARFLPVNTQPFPSALASVYLEAFLDFGLAESLL